MNALLLFLISQMIFMGCIELPSMENASDTQASSFPVGADNGENLGESGTEDRPSGGGRPPMGNVGDLPPGPELFLEDHLTGIPAGVNLSASEVQFASDINYYNNNNREESFDIFLPRDRKKAPLVIYMHGGGFYSGDKDDVYDNQEKSAVIESLLAQGVAVANLNYTLLSLFGPADGQGVKKSLHAARYALQFIRYHANVLGIDGENIVLWGNSAGASIALWMALRDDMARFDQDQVAAQSTRVKAAVLVETQASLNLDWWDALVFADFDFELFELAYSDFALQLMLEMIYGISSVDEYFAPGMNQFKAEIDALAAVSADDPEIWASNTKQSNGSPMAPGGMDRSHLLHHAYHVRELQKAYQAYNLPIVTYYGESGSLYKDPSGEQLDDFILRKLGL
jgi:pimeloyl-ACP methyl ester carboxylesterase